MNNISLPLTPESHEMKMAFDAGIIKAMELYYGVPLLNYHPMKSQCFTTLCGKYAFCINKGALK